MKTYKLTLALLCSLFMLSGCSHYDVEPAQAPEGSILDKLKNTMWYYGDEKLGQYVEIYYSSNGLTTNEMSHLMSTGSTWSNFSQLSPEGQDEFVFVGDLKNLKAKQTLKTPNCLYSATYNTLTHEWGGADCLRITKELYTFTDGGKLTAQDLGVASLDDVTILQEMLLERQDNALVPISGGDAYVRVNSNDPYVIKIFIVDNTASNTDNFCMLHYERVLGKSKQETEHLLGGNYTTLDDDHFAVYMDRDVFYTGPFNITTVAWDDDWNTYVIMVSLREGTNVKHLHKYLSSAYDYKGDIETNGVKNRYYVHKGCEYDNSPYLVMYNPKEQNVTFVIQETTIDDLTGYEICLGLQKDFIIQALELGEPPYVGDGWFGYDNDGTARLLDEVAFYHNSKNEIYALLLVLKDGDHTDAVVNLFNATYVFAPDDEDPYRWVDDADDTHVIIIFDPEDNTILYISLDVDIDEDETRASAKAKLRTTAIKQKAVMRHTDGTIPTRRVQQQLQQLLRTATLRQ